MLPGESFSVPQLAKRHHIGESKIRALIRAGQLEAFDVSTRPGGRPQWRITMEAWERFQATRSSSVRVQASPIRRRRDRRITEYFQ